MARSRDQRTADLEIAGDSPGTRTSEVDSADESRRTSPALDARVTAGLPPGFGYGDRGALGPLARDD